MQLPQQPLYHRVEALIEVCVLQQCNLSQLPRLSQASLAGGSLRRLQSPPQGQSQIRQAGLSRNSYCPELRSVPFLTPLCYRIEFKVVRIWVV